MDVAVKNDHQINLQICMLIQHLIETEDEYSMALSDAATTSLAGMWGGYEFYLIRDRHFTHAAEIVDRFLEHYQPIWRQLRRPADLEFLENPEEVRNLLMPWAEDKLSRTEADDSVSTIEANILFKQLLYGQEEINFGSSDTNWKKKTEIAKELQQYRPWSVAHAAANYGGTDKLRQQAISIIDESGSSSAEKTFFKGWWELSESIDRPMLFPQVWGHTSGKLWIPTPNEKFFPAFFSFGLINVLSRAKLLIQCEPQPSKVDGRWKTTTSAKRDEAEGKGWLVFQFSYDDVMNNLHSCFKRLGGYLTY